MRGRLTASTDLKHQSKDVKWSPGLARGKCHQNAIALAGEGRLEDESAGRGMIGRGNVDFSHRFALLAASGGNPTPGLCQVAGCFATIPHEGNGIRSDLAEASSTFGRRLPHYQEGGYALAGPPDLPCRISRSGAQTGWMPLKPAETRRRIPSNSPVIFSNIQSRESGESRRNSA